MYVVETPTKKARARSCRSYEQNPAIRSIVDHPSHLELIIHSFGLVSVNFQVTCKDRLSLTLNASCIFFVLPNGCAPEERT